MNLGMLWYEPNKSKTLEQVITEAVKYYTDKYGKVATCVFVHPSQASEQSTVVGIEVEANRAVLPQNYWIGVKDQ